MSENKDVEKLSLEGLENISGGSFSYEGGDTCIWEGKEMSIEEFNHTWLEIEKRVGFGLACLTFESITGYTDPMVATGYGNMEWLLKRFWASKGK